MNMIVKNHPNVKYHEIDVTNPESMKLIILALNIFYSIRIIHWICRSI